MLLNMKKIMKTHSNRFSKSFLLVSFMFLILCNFSLSAQTATVTGLITDKEGNPVAGVSIVQKGTKNGAATDFDGNYSITLTASGQKVLVLASLGYKSKEVVVRNRKKINILLEASSELLDEIVISVGYGTALKKDVLGSVTSVKAAELNEAIPEDALQGLQGRASGVQILTGGAPGSSSDIVIRGLSTLSGGVGPLYVVDGQQVPDIDNINPNDIQSIDVLKDGASTAIYGTNGANGVVLVTTKRGNSGVPTVKVSIQNGLSVLTRKVPVSNTKQWNKFRSLRTGSTDNSGGTTDSLGIRTQLVVDIQDLIQQIGQKTQANISFSGGNDSAKFYWSTGFLEEEGIVIGSGFKRVNTNINVDFTLNDVIKAGTRFNGSFQLQDGIQEGAVFRELSYRQPDVLIYDFDGSFIRERFARANPVARALLATNDNAQYRASSFNYVDFQLTPSLSFKTTLGINFRLQKINRFRPSQTVDITRDITGQEIQRLSYDLQNENYFNYKKKFKGGHSVTGLLGFSVQLFKQETSELNAIAFNNDYITTFNNVREFNLDRTGTGASENSLSSIYTRVSYDFRKKYLFSASLRRDGSSRFGKDNLWGNFPGASLGWRLSEENFIKDLNLNFLSEFKLRASYAVTGNQRIGNDRDVAVYEPGFFYDGASGIAATRLGNNLLAWEETAQQNYGVDLNLFKRRLLISVDRYIKTTEDLLYNRPIPEETGFSFVTANIGSIENKGFDIEISGTPIQTKNFKWNSSFNISFNQNKVLSLADEDGFEEGAYFIEQGQPIGNMYGFKNLGIYRYDESNAYTEAGVRLQANFDENDNFSNHSLNGEIYTGVVKQHTFAGNRVLGGGDVIWEDQDGDFDINASNDRTIIGNGLADYIGGFRNQFTYKNLSMSFLFNFNFGNDIYRGYDQTRNKAGNSVYAPGPGRIEGAWINQGDITRYPSLQASRLQNRTGFDSDYVSQGDFIRLQNVVLNYNFSKEVLEKVNIFKSLSMSVVANNLLTFTNYEGYNPELGFNGNALRPGFDNLRFPNKTSVLFSLNAQF